ncbi:MAG: ABC transporter substrate-binding protein [Bdellovibrionales bacterium]|nr:ABC transporter substrate-binding protein [Bdellovibrionales bacterium]
MTKAQTTTNQQMIKNNYLIFFFSLFTYLYLSSCAHVPVPKPKPRLHPSAKAQLKTLLYQYNKKQINDFKLIKKLKIIEQTYPNTHSFFQSLFLRSKLALKSGDLGLQIQLLEQIALSKYNSPLIKRAILRLIKFSEERRQYQFAVSFILQLKIKQLDAPLQNYLYTKLFKYYYQLQQYFNALAAGQSLADNKSLQFAIKKQISWIVKNLLSEKEIATLVREKKYPDLQIFALMRYGKLMLKEKNFSEAKKTFLQLFKTSQDQNEKQSALSFLQKIKKYKSVNKNKIGLIVPLTGKYKKIGRAIVNAVSLGLGIWDKKSNSWLELIIVDSHGSNQHTELAVHKLLTQDQVIAIIGNPLSKTSKIVAKAASQFEVPYISLSQSPDITINRPYVFRNSITSKMQLEILFNAIQENFSANKWATLYPNDAYGTKHSNLFWDIVLENKQSIVGAQSYPSKEKDFNKEVKSLSGLYFLKDREEEYKKSLKQWLSKNKNKRRAHSVSVDNLLKPVLQFQALFIPDTFRSLIQISNMLIYHEIDDILLLGTNLWNKPKLIKFLPKYTAPILFADSSLTYKDKKNSFFYKEFKKIFYQRPHLLASYAYEAAHLVKETLTKNNISTRLQLQTAMSKTANFLGAFETLYISENREFTRPLSLYQIKKNKIQIYKKETK